MNNELPSRQESQREDAPESFVEASIALVARWIQIAAILWLSLLLPRYSPALPRLVGDALYWLSWLAMIGGSVAFIAIAYCRPKFRAGLLRSVVLL